MSPEELHEIVRSSGFDCAPGPDAHSFWLEVPADEHAIRFGVALLEHRLELVFRFGHLADRERERIIDLLYLNHETNHFRVALNEHMDLYLLGTWPSPELDRSLVVWLVMEFARTCEAIQTDVADLLA
jgi:hypothetical protein